MLSQMLDRIEGADVFVILSLLIFILLFVGASAYVWKADKGHITKMSELPFNESNNHSDIS
jgi:hypothetical protein